MPELIIDETRCTRCGLCMTACPQNLIRSHDGLFPRYGTDGASRCIICGHCVAVCPEEALELEDQRLDGTADDPSEAGIAPQRLASFLRMRRSVRRYRDVPVEREVIEQVMDVVRYAPTGGNIQGVRWLIIHSTPEVRRLTGIAVDWMRTVMVSDAPINSYFNFEGIVRAWDKGGDPICRKAPHLVVAYAHKDSAIAGIDAVIALSHLEIVALSFGLGSCWAGFFQMASSHWPPLRAALDLPDGHVPIYAMMLGYPQLRYLRPPRRNPVSLTWR